MVSQLTTLVRTDKPPIVFVSYSHKDEKWKDALLPQLRNLEKLGTVEVWDDRRIKAGTEWYAKIKDVLSRTKVAICLISSNFLSSSFCLDEEMAYLLQARNRGDLEIIPVLVEDCVWKPHRWLKRLQMFPRDGQNVTTHFSDDPAQIFSAVANQTHDMLQPSYVFKRPPPAGDPPEKEDIKRLPQTGDLLFGRREEMDALDGIWNDKELNVAVFKASGGVGKSSLIRAWVEDMALDNYRGACRVFAWSFYSQGTKERVTSADEFISHALGWFGDDTKGEGLSPWDRGQRLADLVREKRTLLLLDGLEPLQSGQAFDRGKIKDPGLEVLLDELGRSNPGLCLIFTREEVSDLWHEEDECQVGQFDLDTISTTAGRALLRVSGIEGEDAALEQVVQDFGQHAYAVKLLGSFLTWCGTPDIEHAGNIPDLPKVEEKDGKHPRRVMAAFADRFGDNAKADILAMLGLFDRPADAGCIAALRKEPAVSGLNAAVLPISKATWQEQIAELRTLGLLTPESHHAPDELDAHPLVREHFGTGLQARREDVWKAGHERLYEHLKNQAPYRPDTLAEMGALFQAVHHGCAAGRYRKTLHELYRERIVRDNQYYLTRNLGAFGADLGVLSHFFAGAFEKPVDDLSLNDRALLLNQIAFRFRALGRTQEAVAPFSAALSIRTKNEDWNNAVVNLCNLTDLLLLIGNLRYALKSGMKSTVLAKKAKILPQIVSLSTLGDIFHQSGDINNSMLVFQEAEQKQAEFQPTLQRLYSYSGFLYCDLLSSMGRIAEVSERAQYILDTVFEGTYNALDVGLGQLLLGQSALASGDLSSAMLQLNKAADSLKNAGTIHILPRAFISRSVVFRTAQEYLWSRKNLSEALRLATRCGMRLHECDAHLEYARLEIKEGQPDAARVHVKSADALVTACGYHRRDGEVSALKDELGI